MNKLIWIEEKELNIEEKFISKLKSKNEISGCWCLGQGIKPITFEKENFIINWSYLENKVEFYMNSEYAEMFTKFYFYLIYYGEWGELEEKKIIFMEIVSEKNRMKSKKPFRSENLYTFIKKNEFIKLTIYFEPTIQEDPEEDSYKSNNNIWISCLGGLYHIIDPYWELNNKNSIKFEKKEWKIWKIEKYDDWDENLFLETAETSKELKKNKMKWELFKFYYS